MHNYIIFACFLALLLSCSGNFEEIPYSSRAKTSSSSFKALSSSSMRPNRSSSSFVFNFSSSSFASSQASSSSTEQDNSSSSSIPSSSSEEFSSSSVPNSSSSYCTAKDNNGEYYCSDGTLKKYDFVTIDGVKYKTVEIGNQIWMAENLRINFTGSMCDNIDCNGYGRLYNWEMATSLHCGNLHLPTKAEWERLKTSVGDDDDAGKKLKATSSDWGESGIGTDNYGFAAMPSGYYSYSDGSYNVDPEGNWWARDDNGFTAQVFNMSYNTTKFNNVIRDKSDFISVRCVKDKTETQ